MGFKSPRARASGVLAPLPFSPDATARTVQVFVITGAVAISTRRHGWDGRVFGVAFQGAGFQCRGVLVPQGVVEGHGFVGLSHRYGSKFIVRRLAVHLDDEDDRADLDGVA